MNPALPAPAVTRWPAVANPGQLWLGTPGRGLLRFGREGLEQVLAHPFRIQQMVSSPDGDLYVVANYQLFKRGPTGTSEPTDPELSLIQLPDQAPVDRVGAGPGGDLWVLTSGGVMVLQGGEWTMHRKTHIEPSREDVMIRDVLVDSAGLSWIVLSDGLRVPVDGKWQRWLSPMATESKNPVTGGVLEDGVLYLTHSRGMTRFTGAGYTEAWFPKDLPPVHLIRWGGAGTFWLVGGGRLFRWKFGETVVHEESVESSTGGRHIHFLTVDGMGRYWLSTDLGVYVGGNAMALTRLPHTDVLELSVPVTTILAEGLEVPLPKEVAIGRGAMVGTVMSKGFPLIGVAVALCAHPKKGQDGTPCDGALFRRVAATDDEGHFRMEGVAVGAYRLSVRHAGRWIIGDTVVGQDLRHGQVKDVGLLVVTESELLQVQRESVVPADGP